MPDRFFKVKIGTEDAAEGRFKGSTPGQAAKKALTQIYRKNEDGKSTKGKVQFSMVECTRGSGCKEYKYTGQRVKLAEPVEVTYGKGKNATTVTRHYKNEVRPRKD